MISDKYLDYSKLTTITSSTGEFEIDRTTGEIIEDRSTGEYEIDRFNLDEYKAYYKLTEIEESIDILDVGYWLADGAYEPPESDWRKEVKIMREGGEL